MRWGYVVIRFPSEISLYVEPWQARYVLIRPRWRALLDPVWGILFVDALKLELVLSYVFHF